MLMVILKVRDHCHFTGKYRGYGHTESKRSLLCHWKIRGSRHTYCIINVKLNHKIPALFHNLKNMIRI